VDPRRHGHDRAGRYLQHPPADKQGRLDPALFATHRFALEETMAAYDTFADAASTNALKVVLQGTTGE
jgi:threonine dehydrogenase-like Zn-dependent dehydrogenase